MQMKKIISIGIGQQHSPLFKSLTASLKGDIGEDGKMSE
jgi:hypothetical protein